LENLKVHKAKEYGLDIGEAFPFLIEDDFTSVDWYNIDRKEGNKEVTHEKHKTSSLNGN